MNTDSLYWFLSTVAQVLVALVAFFGFIAIWRLDEFATKRGDARRFLLRIRAQTGLGGASDPSDTALIRMAEDLVRRETEGDGIIDAREAGDVAFQSTNLRDARNAQAKLRRSVAATAATGLIATAYSLVLLLYLPSWCGGSSPAMLLVPLAVAGAIVFWQSCSAAAACGWEPAWSRKLG